MTNKRKRPSESLPETTETRAGFARRMKIDAGYLTRLVQKGLPVTEDGKHVRVEAAISWLRANVSQPGRQPGSIVNGGGDNAGLVAAKLELLRIKIEQETIALETLRGEMIPKRDAVRAVRAYSRCFRDYLLRFGDRWGPSVASELNTPVGFTGGVLDKYMRDALFEVAATPPPFDLDQDDASFPMSEQAIKEAINDK